MKIKKKVTDDPKAIAELNLTPKARLTADIDGKLHNSFKLKCIIEQSTMTEVVEDLIRKYVNT